MLHLDAEGASPLRIEMLIEVDSGQLVDVEVGFGMLAKLCTCQLMHLADRPCPLWNGRCIRRHLIWVGGNLGVDCYCEEPTNS